VIRYYPNGITPRPDVPPASLAEPQGHGLARAKRLLEIVLRVPSPLIEAACRRLYTWHLRRKAGSWCSPDQVSLQPDYLKLHTRSHRHSVLDRFDASVADAFEHAVREAAPYVAAGGQR